MQMLRPVVPGHERMYRMERIEHILLGVSFIALSYTGFALHYPNQWWARPLLAWEDRFPTRGTVHRAAAAILIITAVMHIITLIVNRRLRNHWLELLPRVSDLREMVEGTLWRLGLRKERPFQSSHSYIEKIEYWALVWGTMVMAVTGVLLWANKWTLEFLPKMWLDFSRMIHFYEAVLATLAILIWHFYTVIFDPDVYPMDPSWITGYSPRRDAEHHESKKD
jgi:cytochrome b subunit of formate dehydrogenase